MDQYINAGMIYTAIVAVTIGFFKAELGRLLSALTLTDSDRSI